jgi:putative glycosyltransferase (TIGR04372 family)
LPVSAALGLVVRLLAPLLVRLRVRVYQANLHRIGDMNLELARYVKWRELGWLPPERAVVVPAPTARRPANPVALRYLGRRVRVVTNGALYPLLFRLRMHPRLGGNLDDDVRLPDGRWAIYWLGSTAAEQPWQEQSRPPLLSLDPEHERSGRSAVESLGVPRGAWFACLHAREGGFLRETAQSHHRQKNVDVRTYVAAAEAIVAAGGWVVRVGDPSMRPLPELDGVIDYAHSPIRSGWLDVYLAASCRFWLGSNSGLYMLAQNFGTPVAMANLVPHSFRIWGPDDVVILKRCLAEDGRPLSFGESLRPELFHAADIERHGVQALDNSPEEIAELAREMLERTAGEAVYTAEDEERQHRYDALTPYYPYGISSRIGRDFLRRYEHLIGDPFTAELPTHSHAGHRPHG